MKPRIRQNDNILKISSLYNHICDGPPRICGDVNSTATRNEVPRYCVGTCENLTIQSS